MPHNQTARKNVLVIGASSGIGLSTTNELCTAGFQVVAWSRTGPPADQDLPSLVTFQSVDVRRTDVVADALRSLPQPPDGVVYVAGIARWGQVGEQDTEEWRDVLETNAVGAYTVLNQFAKIFGRHPRRVVGVASDAARCPAAGRSAYHSSKAALASLLESYRLEVRDHGTLVTVVYPGKVNTSLSARSAAANAVALQPDDVARLVRHLFTLDEHIEVRSLEVSSIHSPYGLA